MAFGGAMGELAVNTDRGMNGQDKGNLASNVQ